MIAYVVTEGPFDAALLRKLLPEEASGEVEIVPAGGLSAAKSLARSLVARRQRPVAIVMDADAVLPEVVEERRQSAEEALQDVAGAVPFRVIMAIPTLEAIFFAQPAVLERLLGIPVLPELSRLAETTPKRALEEMLARSGAIRKRSDLPTVMTPADVQALRETPAVKELIDFLVEARAVSLSAA